MRLILHARPQHAGADQPGISQTFGVQGGTIGRDPRCDMVLNNVQCSMPDMLAHVVFEGGEFQLVNISQQDTIHLGEQTVAPHMSMVLRDGDAWHAGGFRVLTEYTAQADNAGMAESLHAPLPQGAMFAASSPGVFDDLLGGSAGGELNLTTATANAHHSPPQDSGPFADLLRDAVTSQMASAPVAQASPVVYNSSYIPEDFNPLALDGVSRRNALDPLQEWQNPSEVHEMFPEQSVDALFHPEDGSIARMTAELHPANGHDALLDADGLLDPLRLFGAMGNSGPDQLLTKDVVPEFTQSTHRTEIVSYFRAPQAIPAEEEALLEALAPDVLQPPSPLEPEQGLPDISESFPDANVELPPAAPAEAKSVITPPNDAVTHVDLGIPFDWPESSSDESVDEALSALVATAAPPSAPPKPTESYPIANDCTATLQPLPVTETYAYAPNAAIAPPADTDQLLHAFKSGAGLLEVNLPAQLSPDIMCMIGAMVSACAQGFAAQLNEEQKPGEVSPPERLGDDIPQRAALALSRFLDPTLPEYLSGADAVARTFHHLHAQNTQALDVVQSNWMGIFAQLAPQVIEESIHSPGLPPVPNASRHKAMLWDAFCARYRMLLQENGPRVI